MAIVYDNTYQVPQGFFVDARAATPRSYTLYHVKDASVSYELCSNDFSQAMDLERADNDARAVRGEYVGSIETDMYFEFIRELSFSSSISNIGDVTSPGFSRVFKCTYVDRDGVDRNLRNGYAGTLNAAPLTKQELRNFTEYMWQFAYFDATQKKVLESTSSEKNLTIEHTLLLALQTNQGTDNCDRIEVVDWVFSIDKSSGQTSKKYNKLYEFAAQLVNGQPQKCES